MFIVDFGWKLDDGLFLPFASDKVSTEQPCQLKEGGDTSIRETIEPLLGNSPRDKLS